MHGYAAGIIFLFVKTRIPKELWDIGYIYHFAEGITIDIVPFHGELDNSALFIKHIIPYHRLPCGVEYIAIRIHVFIYVIAISNTRSVDAIWLNKSGSAANGDTIISIHEEIPAMADATTPVILGHARCSPANAGPLAPSVIILHVVASGAGDDLHI